MKRWAAQHWKLRRFTRGYFQNPFFFLRVENVSSVIMLKRERILEDVHVYPANSSQFHARLSNNRRISIRAIGYGNRTRQFKEGIRQKRERTFNREALCSLRSQSLSLLRSGKSENDCFVTGVPFPRNIPKITSRYSRQRTSTVRPIFSFQPCFKTVRGWGDIIVYPLRIRAKSYTISEDSSSSIVIRNVLEKHALLSMFPRYDLVSRDEHLMLYAHDKSVYSIIIIQCWSLIEAILQLKYPNSSSSSRYYILSMRTRRIESTGRTKTTNAFDEFEDGGDVETTKERGQAYGRRGRWIRVCRKRIEFTARFLRRPIVAGFNSDSFSTRHIKFMACTVRITHPPERVNTRRPLKGCETTTPRLASSFPLFPFSRLFSPGHLREWIFRRFFHSPPPPRTVLNIYDFNVFTRNFCRATEHARFNRIPDDRSYRKFQRSSTTRG